VFTKKVAFAIVVSLTAKMKVAKCRLRNTPETATRVKSRLPRNRKLRLADVNRIIAKAAMKRRKNVSDIAEASVANLMKIAAVAKKKEATNRATIPFDANKKEPLVDFGSSDDQWLHRTLPFNYVSGI
jgi:ERCC4-type nuclease